MTSRENYYKDIYRIMDELKKRPGMFYCTYRNKKSFNALIAFTLGLTFTNIDEGNPSFRGFSRWITGRVQGMSKALPWDWMDKQWGDEESFDRFFELLDEYRLCQEVRLYKAVDRDYEPTFKTQIDGEMVKPEQPSELYISQFQPSEVYYLLEIYAEREEEEFPYQNSIDEVKKSAKSKWKVSDDEWLTL